jgi:hypothetical protein
MSGRQRPRRLSKRVCDSRENPLAGPQGGYPHERQRPHESAFSAKQPQASAAHAVSLSRPPRPLTRKRAHRPPANAAVRSTLDPDPVTLDAPVPFAEGAAIGAAKWDVVASNVMQVKVAAGISCTT